MRHSLSRARYDAVIVGSGPNGLAAAITLARVGARVLVVEAKPTIGGGLRSSAALTAPGFVHDICSAIHPLALGSPFMQTLPWADYGVEWITPPLAMAHPFDDGDAAALHPGVAETAAQFSSDSGAYYRLLQPLVRDWRKLMHEFLGPLRIPRHPWAMARFGLAGLLPAAALARQAFARPKTQGFFAGLAAHAIQPLSRPATAAFGLILAVLGHAVGWPFPKGGAQRIADAMAAYLVDLGGEIRTDFPVRGLAELPIARATILDVAPRGLLEIAGERLPAGYRRALERYRYGPGVCKVDWALTGPIPWQAEACCRAGTIHLGATLAAIEQSEDAAWQGIHAPRPYVLVAQPSRFDHTRAPQGKQTAWAYCHAPHGSDVDMTGAIEAQVERFAPGFRARILARHTYTAQAMQAYNANYVGGDINGGVQDLGQLFTRPVARFDPYATGLDHVYLCSSSTPPGGGVHGMGGYFAAQSALRRSLR